VAAEREADGQAHRTDALDPDTETATLEG